MSELGPLLERACELNKLFAERGDNAVIRYLRLLPAHPVTDEHLLDVVIEMPPYRPALVWSQDILEPLYTAVEYSLGELMPVSCQFRTAEDLKDPIQREGEPVPEPPGGNPSEAAVRRSMSTSYYALFRALNAEVAAPFQSQVHAAAHRLAEHGVAADACRRLARRHVPEQVQALCVASIARSPSRVIHS